jgi:hypothetical protein
LRARRVWVNQPRGIVQPRFDDPSLRCAWLPQDGAEDAFKTVFSLPSTATYVDGALRLNSATQDVIELRVPVTSGVQFFGHAAVSVDMTLRTGGFASFLAISHEGTNPIDFFQRRNGAQFRINSQASNFDGPFDILNSRTRLTFSFPGGGGTTNGSAQNFDLFFDGVLARSGAVGVFMNRNYITVRVGSVRGATESATVDVHGIAVWSRPRTATEGNLYSAWQQRRAALPFGAAAAPTGPSLTLPTITNLGATSVRLGATLSLP